MIEDSLRRHGAGRSILLDKHGNIVAGNKTAENAAAIGMDDVLVVQTDGKRLVAVQRMDLDLADPQTRQLAIADNRSAELSLAWDAEILAGLSEEVDLSAFWTEDEMAALVSLPSGSSSLGGSTTLAERFGVPPFSVLDARQGYWQERKAAWLALGIQSEIGRGGGRNSQGPPTVTQNPDGTLNHGGTKGQAERFNRQRRAAAPGGSARPAYDYSRKERGDGRGRPLVTHSAA
jgi:hypothetical protein